MLASLVSSVWKPATPKTTSMTVEAGAQPAQLAPGDPEMQHSIITSSKRKEPGAEPSSAKRQRLASATDVKGSCTDFQAEQDQRRQSGPSQGTPQPVAPRDQPQQQSQQLQQSQQQQHDTPSQQQQQQQQQQQGAGAGKPKSPLGHILTPVYYLLNQGRQHFGGTPTSSQQQRQEDGEGAGGEQQHPACAGAGARHDQESRAAAGQPPAGGGAECATSTTSTVTTGSVLAPEASDSVADGAAPAGPRPRAADSGCDSDAEGAGADAAAAAPSGADVEDEDDEEWFDPLLFISRLPPAAPPGALRPGALLPRRTRACKQKTLVLDLDETLVHSTLDSAPGSEGAHFHFPVHFNGAEHMVHVRMRPHMRDFLERAAELFEVVVFTASQKVYAEKLLNILDPTRRLVRHRIYRDSCVFVDGNYLKDLSGLGRDLAHTAIVDNSPQAFGFQVDNGIPIESWYDDEADTELLQLLPLLAKLADADDVRPVLRERFRLRERVEGAAATWRSRMEQEAAAAAAAAAAWQRGYLPPARPAAQLPPAPQLQRAQVQHAAAAAAQQPGGGMMQQALPHRQFRAAAVAAAATQLN